MILRRFGSALDRSAASSETALSAGRDGGVRGLSVIVIEVYGGAPVRNRLLDPRRPVSRPGAGAERAKAHTSEHPLTDALAAAGRACNRNRQQHPQQ